MLSKKPSSLPLSPHKKRSGRKEFSIKKPLQVALQGFSIKSLAMSYFRIDKSKLSLALSGFTSEFEMGSGGSHSLSSPGNLTCIYSPYAFSCE